MNTKQNIHVDYHLDGMTELLTQDIKTRVNHNLEHQVDAYLKKVLTKPDAQVKIKLNMQEQTKNKHTNYHASVLFNLDGHSFQYTTSEPFQNPRDLVNHAFKHLKEHLSH